MIVAYIFGSISIAFAFSVVGLLINNAIKHTGFYKRLSHFNFVTSEKANRYLGVLYFRQILVRSFWRHLNPALKLTQRPDRQKLRSLRNEMTYAEISHLFAFLLVAAVAIASKVWHYREQGISALIISNIVFHLYPALVQQYNKRRLDRIIKRSNT
ncbi:glycosyl-4,4'-diaponeurosporenoate acyltransferase CrtO family protein [Flavobacterium sp.]|uniref:glycosyl-4,4'-diaponeurosporenoate acyltransferase CrtO family protein n=1 Tax=Flavobacterium sp. TaxID=239 RepID=UPI0040341CA9